MANAPRVPRSMDIKEEGTKIFEACPTRAELENFWNLKTAKSKLKKVPNLSPEHTYHSLRLSYRHAVLLLEWPWVAQKSDLELVELWGDEAYRAPEPESEEDLLPLEDYYKLQATRRKAAKEAKANTELTLNCDRTDTTKGVD